MGKVQEFLDLYRSRSTRASYRKAIEEFLGVVVPGDEDVEQKADKYLSEQRDREKDIYSFTDAISDLAPKTRALKISGVRTFLAENGVELPTLFWRRLRQRRIKGATRALTLDKVPSNKELKTVLTHLPIQGKALFLLMASSGMRIGETLKLALDDLDLEKRMVNIRGEYTKTGTSRRAFFSAEAKEFLNEWLRNRDRYLEQAKGRSVLHRKKGDSDKVFPFSKENAYYLWNGALRKSGNGDRDKQTGIRKLHPHVLRKFFRTKMGGVIPIDVVEALMGHEGYLTEVYRRYSLEDLAKFYREGEHALLVFTEAGEVNRLRQEIEERNKQLQVLVNGLTAENISLKERMKGIEKDVDDLRATVRKMLGTGG